MSLDLELLNLSKNFNGNSVVDSLSIGINKGEFVSLLGPSGCGKSTTLMMIAGFEDPSAGEILVQGSRIDTLLPEKRNIGVVFQSYALFPHMTVQRNVEYGLKMRKVEPSERKRRAQKILEMVHMQNFADRLPGQLSGGQQQRVALARALITEPDILLLDEPFSALDRQLREDLQREVRSLQKKLGITTIFVTHDQNEALLMSDRIAIMNKGRIEQCDEPEKLYRYPSTGFVAKFIGQGSFFDANISNQINETVSVSTSFGMAHHVPFFLKDKSSKIQIFFRPEDILSKSDSNSDGINFSAHVKNIYFQGSSSMADLYVENEEKPIVLDLTAYTKNSVSIGDKLNLFVPSSKLHVFSN